MKQNPSIIRKVLDFRMARVTADQFNDDASKMTPEMVKMMKELRESLDNG